MLPTGVMKLSQVCERDAHVSFVIIHLNTEFRLIVAVYRNTVQ